MFWLNPRSGRINWKEFGGMFFLSSSFLFHYVILFIKHKTLCIYSWSEMQNYYHSEIKWYHQGKTQKNPGWKFISHIFVFPTFIPENIKELKVIKNQNRTVLKYSTPVFAKLAATVGVVNTAATGWPLPIGFPIVTMSGTTSESNFIGYFKPT